ncbi:solute carrier family 22 member 5-like [Helicoverpa zea]|uniref:solute carrier family 22 member 5-like n=1 Tax=Helicoverpa zea TaxID=7113 RepID=UPI001F58B501|nr:solute carrier family 22 member 5-like [Helicoverpa zea]
MTSEKDVGHSKDDGKNPIEEAKCKEQIQQNVAEDKFKSTDVVPKKDVVDLESMLRELKIFGRYHIKFVFLVGALTFMSMWHSTNYVFAVENVGYRCKYPNCDYTEIVKLDQNSSFDHKCHKYAQHDDNGFCRAENFDLFNVTECDEWIYDKPDSFVAEFDLACEDWKRTLVGTMHSVGYMLGLFIVGPLSDKFGRKSIIILTSVAGSLIGLSKSWVYSYWLYVVLEMMEPLLGDCYSATFTLSIETVTKEHRPFIIFVLNLFTTFGGICVAIIAWLAPTWRIFVIVIYAPGLLFVLYIFWMDESLRWLLNKGKKDEVGVVFRQAAKTNNITIDEGKLSNLKCEDNSTNISLMASLKITFSSKQLFLRLLCCICMWFTALFNSYSLLINSVSLKGNKYLNYGLTILSGIPASIAIYYLLTKFKRKNPLIFAFLLTGTFCMAHSIVPTDYAWLSILLYVSGKFFSTISIRIVYIYTSELFPTYTRNTMHALCSALGRIAAIIAPQTPLLMQYWPGLPSMIMGILSILTACVVTLLPDTSDEVLPDNVGQAEAVGKKDKNNFDFCSKL